ncbi:type II secretion system F family protein [Corynebacterium epidermidicanis]|uniref:type II secretion system F family protein n=1 Tax=Corynebacterium epidermidicanis TaxID=1050174 RepID=UPI00130D9E2A|nr:type II secretion system F family protein [Corynebacterium epidermidicanis]
MLLATALLVLPTGRASHRIAGQKNHQVRWSVLTVPVVVIGAWWAGVGLLLAGTVVAATLWWTVQRGRRRRTATRNAQATAAVVGQLLSDVAAGASIGHSIRGISANLPPATTPEIAGVLHTTARHTAMGASGAHLLIDAPSTCPDLRYLGKLWAVSESRGIALGVLLEQCQRRIDTRLRHSASTQASLQGPQATAVVLALLPLAGIGMGAAMGAHPLEFLCQTSLGNVLLIGGVSLACGGFAWVQVMTHRAAGHQC